MKKIATAILACGILASGTYLASAATMRLSADGGLTWTNIVDNGPGDSDPELGSIEYDGPVGGWTISVTTGLGTPFIGSPIAPMMDVSSVNSSAGAASLIIQMSDVNFVPFNNETFIAGLAGHTAGTVTFNSYRDTGNVLFGTTANYPSSPASATANLLMAEGPLNGILSVSNGVVVPVGGVGPYSLTLETIIVHTGSGFTSTDASLTATPPPCDCTLTFNGPARWTNCPDDALPAITASQVCVSGSGDVPVTLVSSVTNGSCPSTITRIFSATDSCNNAHSFTQTVIVNCKPDCTITPSVTTTTVGATNTASVADAGPGAVYVWNVLNGSIVSGQGTPNLTWKAGTDTSSPISILITITAATGCQSDCSASVKLTTPPSQFGHGDAATMGFWQNKNGQGLINGAPSGPPTLANWLAATFPCLYGSTSVNNLTGKSNADVAKLFVTLFKGTSPKTDAQVMSVALASYFTDTTLGGGAGPVKFGFNQSAGGTGAKMFNVGSFGTALGLSNNTSYPILQIVQAASALKCSNPTAVLPKTITDLFNAINTGGDIN